MTNEDERWAALTAEQQAFLLKLARAPWRWFVSDERYAGTWRRMEKENARAAEAQAVAKQRNYYELLNRATTYDGPDYRIRLVGQRVWIRASERQYEQAAYTGVQRSIGVPDEPALLQITA